MSAHAAFACSASPPPASGERKTVSVGSSAIKGVANAPVTMVVFSDFECLAR